jgi:hypothetical protein
MEGGHSLVWNSSFGSMIFLAIYYRYKIYFGL